MNKKKKDVFKKNKGKPLTRWTKPELIRALGNVDEVKTKAARWFAATKELAATLYSIYPVHPIFLNKTFTDDTKLLIKEDAKMKILNLVFSRIDFLKLDENDKEKLVMSVDLERERIKIKKELKEADIERKAIEKEIDKDVESNKKL